MQTTETVLQTIFLKELLRQHRCVYNRHLDSNRETNREEMLGDFTSSYIFTLAECKYMCMINKKTYLPFRIPSVASDKLNVRLLPAQKAAIKKLGVLRNQSMSKVALEIFNYYFENAIQNDFWKDIYEYSDKNKKSGRNFGKIMKAATFLGNLLKCA